jgi:hypothetical protein
MLKKAPEATLSKKRTQSEAEGNTVFSETREEL